MRAHLRLDGLCWSGAVTCCSALVSDLLGWMGTGGGASSKRVPPFAFGWPDVVLRAFLHGLVDGDGRTDDVRTSVWTTSEGLVADLLLIFARLGLVPLESWFTLVGDRLTGAHLHDVDGLRDHRAPGIRGGIDFAGLATRLPPSALRTFEIDQHESDEAVAQAVDVAFVL